MEYFKFANNWEQLVFNLILIVVAVGATAFFGIMFGLGYGIQTGLIIATLYLSGYSYAKQVKASIIQSVDRLPKVQVDGYVIVPLVFDTKLRPRNPHCTIQFKLYERKEAGLAPADMNEFLKNHFEDPAREFENPDDIAIASNYPSRVAIERKPFIDPEGLRLRTKSTESTQLRRLAEQTMWKISSKAKENKSENKQDLLIE